VKMMTEPRSIWNELADVSVRPMYMADVAQRSSKAWREGFGKKLISTLGNSETLVPDLKN